MNEILVYIGSYSSEDGNGIYIYRLDEKTGELTKAFEPVKALNPSYLRLGPKQKYLYAVLETGTFQNTSGGGAAAYALNPDGSLALVNEQPTGGAGPCHLCLHEKLPVLYTANYSSGSLSAFALGADGGLLAPAQVTQHFGTGPNALRQAGPHVHFTEITPDGQHLCAVDLGLDRIFFYPLQQNGMPGAEDITLSVALNPGSGPRHMLFRENGDLFYVLTELSGELLVFQKKNGRYEQVQRLSTIPEDFKGENYPAALKVSPNGNFLCASNRGHDSLAVYRIQPDGTLSLCGISPTGGRWPRDFAFSPNGKFIIAANERSNDLTVLRFDSESGTLSSTAVNEPLHRPVCIQLFTNQL